MNWMTKCETCNGVGTITIPYTHTCRECGGAGNFLTKEGLELLEFLRVFHSTQHTHDELIRF